MKWKAFFIIVMAVLLFITGILWMHNVPSAITAQDEKYIHLLASAHGIDFDAVSIEAKGDFQGQLNSITKLQDAILTHTPQQKRIPLNTPREPADLYKLDYAQCGDRSRFLEKALSLAGLEVRYASIYSMKNTDYPLLRKGGDGQTSHALIEVKTTKGWMIVDSVVPWVGLTRSGEVVSLQNWDAYKESQWHKGEPYFLLEDDFLYLYGFYSRHGKFYPPYTPYIPDINWQNFIQHNVGL